MIDRDALAAEKLFAALEYVYSGDGRREVMAEHIAAARAGALKEAADYLEEGGHRYAAHHIRALAQSAAPDADGGGT
jgi:hypothetical protein